MPCYSSVKSQMTDAGRLVEALRALGYRAALASKDGLTIRGDGDELFSRARVGDAFSSVQYRSNLDAGAVGAIGRKYAEIGVQAFAKRRGFSVVANDGARMVLKNRRGV